MIEFILCHIYYLKVNTIENQRTGSSTGATAAAATDA